MKLLSIVEESVKRNSDQDIKIYLKRDNVGTTEN